MEKCAGRFNCIVGPTKYRCVFVEYAALFPRQVSNAAVVGTPALTPMEIGCAAIVAAAQNRRRAVLVFVMAVLEHVWDQSTLKRCGGNLSMAVFFLASWRTPTMPRTKLFERSDAWVGPTRVQFGRSHALGVLPRSIRVEPSA